MAYIEIGDEERIDPATIADLDRIFAASRIMGVTVHHDSRYALKAAIAGDSAMIFYIDSRKGRAKMPSERLDRDRALTLLKFYLKSGILPPDLAWREANLPFVQVRKGCGTAAAGLMAGIVAVIVGCSLILL